MLGGKGLLLFGVRPDGRFAYAFLNADTGVLRTLATTNLKETQPELSPAPFFKGDDFWYVKYAAQSKAFVLVRKNLKTGTTSQQELVRKENPMVKFQRVAPFYQGTNTMLLVRITTTSSGKNWEAVLRNYASGKEKLLYHSTNWFKMQSGLQDGKLAFLESAPRNSFKLVVVDASSKEPRLLFSKTLPKDLSLNWGFGPGGRMLLARYHEKPASTEVWTISSETGEMQKTEFSFLGHARISSFDGDRLLFQTTSLHQKVWVMENLLPGTAAARGRKPGHE